MQTLIRLFRRHVMYHYYIYKARQFKDGTGNGKSYLMLAMSARMNGSKVQRLPLSRPQKDDFTISQ
jgi:hypothetical protein